MAIKVECGIRFVGLDACGQADRQGHAGGRAFLCGLGRDLGCDLELACHSGPDHIELESYSRYH